MRPRSEERRKVQAEEAEVDERMIDSAVERRVGIGIEELSGLFLLEQVRGFGPQKFRELDEAGVSPGEVVRDPARLTLSGKRGGSLRKLIAALGEEERELSRQRAVRQILRAEENGAKIVTYRNPLYPKRLFGGNCPVPILYLRGAEEALTAPGAVACVGSRGIRPPYGELHRQFATAAAAKGFAIVSGFATGADTLGHEAARDAGGATVAVMPSGLDRPFPPENRELWTELLGKATAAFVSEFPFGTAAASLTLRKRNKLIVALADGVLISQSSVKGGAMNAYRFALEQKKRVATFAGDGSEATSGNEFIGDGDRRGATKLLGDSETTTVFPAKPDAPLWDRWLQELSSST